MLHEGGKKLKAIQSVQLNFILFIQGLSYLQQLLALLF